MLALGSLVLSFVFLTLVVDSTATATAAVSLAAAVLLHPARARKNAVKESFMMMMNRENGRRRKAGEFGKPMPMMGGLFQMKCCRERPW